MNFRCLGSSAIFVFCLSNFLAAQTPAPITHQAVLTGYRVTATTFCGLGNRLDATATFPATNPLRINHERVCTGSSAKIDYTVSATPLLGGGRIENGGRDIRFDTPLLIDVSAKVDLTIAKAIATSVGFGTPSYDGTALGGQCTPFANVNRPFDGSTTINISSNCVRNPVRTYKAGDVLDFSVSTIANAFLTKDSAVGAQEPSVQIDVFAEYRIEPITNEDLMVTSLHAVQAVQTPTDQVTLIGNKRTVVRAFIKSVGATAKALSGVTATLACIGSDSVRYTAVAGTAPIRALPVVVAPASGTPPNLADASVDFLLPDRCTTPQSSSAIEVEAVPPSGATDPYPPNNKLLRSFAFAKVPGSRPFRIGYVPIPYQPPGQAVPLLPSAAIGKSDKLLRKLYPLPEDGVTQFPVMLTYPPWTKTLAVSADWDVLLADLAVTVLLTDLPAGEDFDQIVGYLSDQAGGLAGIADTLWGGGNGRAVLVKDYGQLGLETTLPHEIGHNLGIRHTNKAAPLSGCPDLAADGDTAWPYANPTIQTHGYFNSTMKVLQPGLFDVMSYCPDEYLWIAPYTFEALFLNDLQPTAGLPRQVIFNQPVSNREETANDVAPPLPSAAPQDLWLITGAARRDNGPARLDSALRVNSSKAPSVSTPSGSHCLLFTGAGGTVLSTHCFTLSFTGSEGDILDQQSFARLIPAVAGATRAAFVVGGQELASIVTAGNIVVNITAPTSGQQWDAGSRTISWTAFGPSPVRFGVQYSYDGGTSWLPLANNLTGTQLVVDTSRLQGGANLRFRVLAGSGLSTGSAEVGPINLVQTPRIAAPAGTFELHNAVVGQGIERTLEISNTGNGPLRLTGIVPSSNQFKIVSPGAPGVIMAGESASLVVLFVPAAVGDVSGTIRIDSNDSPLTIAVHGTGISSPTPEIATLPGSIAFGSVQQGQGATRKLTIVNYGPLALTVSQVSIGGSGFSLAATPVSFTLAANETREIPVRFAPVATGAATGTVTITSNDPTRGSLQVALTGTGTAPSGAALPTIVANGVVNAASFVPGLSRGALGTVVGANMANGTQTINTAPWPLTVAGTKVLIAGIEAPLFYVSATQINFQVPYEVPLGGVSVVVSRDGYESAPQAATITEYAVGVFGYARTSQAYDPIFVHLDGQLVTPANPAVANEVLVGYITGIGGLGRYPITGDRAPVNPLPVALAQPTITLGGAPVISYYIGLTPSYIGLGQVNLQLPAVLPAGSSLPLTINIGGSTVTVNLAVK